MSSTKKFLDQFPEVMKPVAVTTATSKIFEIKEAENLNKEDMTIFHGIVAKLLYTMYRTPSDLVTKIAFMTRRVSNSTLDDWNKLCRLLQYINETFYLPLGPEMDNTRLILW